MACVLADRIITVREVCLCPQMDIAALVTGDGALLVNRTTSWQRFLALEVTGAISALCWSPHGRQLGVGHSRGSVSIFDIEAGALVHSNWGDCVQIKHVDCISLMWWTEQICAEPFVSANLNVAPVPIAGEET
jgi:WD40 repeat protein|mmetsp:Transcript_14561/g.45094  ORF Transcript_14561/g.45094 Transcript_14561/m.45094 type:complete len:133 (+) Transcript_14561:135-533(+)